MTLLVMLTFKDLDDAVALANSTLYGLSAAVWSQDFSTCMTAARRIRAGTIWVNCFFVRDLRAPFGGSKKSGIGREGGNWSFDFYADVKNTVVSPNGWKE